MRKIFVAMLIGLFLGSAVLLTSCGNNKDNGVDNNKDQYATAKVKEEKPKRNYEENHGMDVSIVRNIINKSQKKDGKKVAFLTFDDGPSTNITPKVLDLLKENNIKATFFVCGKNLKDNEETQEILGREADEGHSIGNHSFSHDYYKLYPKENVNIEGFEKEISDTDDLIKGSIGKNFKTRLVRMPNGEMTRRHSDDKNIDKLITTELKNMDKYSVDWNCLTGDAEGNQNKTIDELLNYLKETSKNKEKLVILMHDSTQRENSFNALQKVIDYLKGQGYEFQAMK